MPENDLSPGGLPLPSPTYPSEDWEHIDLYGETLSGISISAWQRFLQIFSEEQTEEEIVRRLDVIARTETPTVERVSDRTIEEIRNRLIEIVELLRSEE